MCVCVWVSGCVSWSLYILCGRNPMCYGHLLGRRVIDPPGQIHCDENILLTVIKPWGQNMIYFQEYVCIEAYFGGKAIMDKSRWIYRRDTYWDWMIVAIAEITAVSMITVILLQNWMKTGTTQMTRSRQGSHSMLRWGDHYCVCVNMCLCACVCVCVVCTIKV